MNSVNPWVRSFMHCPDSNDVWKPSLYKTKTAARPKMTFFFCFAFGWGVIYLRTYYKVILSWKPTEYGFILFEEEIFEVVLGVRHLWGWLYCWWKRVVSKLPFYINYSVVNFPFLLFHSLLILIPKHPQNSLINLFCLDEFIPLLFRWIYYIFAQKNELSFCFGEFITCLLQRINYIHFCFKEFIKFLLQRIYQIGYEIW